MLFKFIDLLNGQIADGLLCQHPEEVSAIRGIPMAHGAFHHLHLSAGTIPRVTGLLRAMFSVIIP